MTLPISHLLHPFYKFVLNLLEAPLSPNYINFFFFPFSFHFPYSIALLDRDSDIDKDGSSYFIFQFFLEPKIHQHHYSPLLFPHYSSSSLRPPMLGHFKAILGVVIVLNGLLNLSLSVHDKRAMLDHWLIKGLASNEHKPEWVW